MEFTTEDTRIPFTSCIFEIKLYPSLLSSNAVIKNFLISVSDTLNLYY